jgi:hypothetical protein
VGLDTAGILHFCPAVMDVLLDYPISLKRDGRKHVPCALATSRIPRGEGGIHNSFTYLFSYLGGFPTCTSGSSRLASYVCSTVSALCGIDTEVSNEAEGVYRLRMQLAGSGCLKGQRPSSFASTL